MRTMLIQTSTMRIPLITVALAIALAALGASPAAAESPLVYRTTSAGATAHGDGDATAICPNGTRLTGGGGGISGKQKASELAALEPVDTASDLDTYGDDAFHVGAYNAANAGHDVTATAICLRAGIDALRYHDSESDLVPDSSFGGSLHCGGDRLVGGGAGIAGGPYLGQVRLRVSAPQDLALDADELFDDGFAVQASNVGAQGHTVRIHIACLPPGERKLRYVSEQRVLATGETRTLKVACPRAFRISGGGGGSTGPAVNTRISRPFDGPDRDSRPDDGWLVQGNNPVTTPQTLFTDAICLR